MDYSSAAPQKDGEAPSPVPLSYHIEQLMSLHKQQDEKCALGGFVTAATTTAATTAATTTTTAAPASGTSRALPYSTAAAYPHPFYSLGGDITGATTAAAAGSSQFAYPYPATTTLPGFTPAPSTPAATTTADVPPPPLPPSTVAELNLRFQLVGYETRLTQARLDIQKMAMSHITDERRAWEDFFCRQRTESEAFARKERRATQKFDRGMLARRHAYEELQRESSSELGEKRRREREQQDQKTGESEDGASRIKLAQHALSVQGYNLRTMASALVAAMAVLTASSWILLAYWPWGLGV